MILNQNMRNTPMNLSGEFKERTQCLRKDINNFMRENTARSSEILEAPRLRIPLWKRGLGKYVCLGIVSGARRTFSYIQNS